MNVELGKDIKGNTDTAIYIPIKDTLKALLNEDVLAYVLNDHSSDDDKWRDYFDGSAYKFLFWRWQNTADSVHKDHSTKIHANDSTRWGLTLRPRGRIDVGFESYRDWYSG